MLHILDIIAKIFFVVIFFGLCIFIHELGHLLVALWQKLYVEKFSVGFGKKIWGKTINGVDYVISMLPFGGYVALPQLDPSDEPKTSDGTVLPSGPPVSRALTAVAGPLANVLFGFFLGLFIWAFGTWEPAPQQECRILSVPPMQATFKDGLKLDDKILSVDGKLFGAPWWTVVQDLPPLPVDEAGRLVEKTLHLTVERGEEEDKEVLEIEYTPMPNPEYYGGASYGEKPEKGLRGGDVILAVNGKGLGKGFVDIKESTILTTEPVELTVRRGDETLDLRYVPAANPYLEGLGHPFYYVKEPVAIEQVIKDTPAERAGLMGGDVLLTINGDEVENAGFFIDVIALGGGAPIDLTVARDGNVVPILGILPERKTVGDRTVFRLGAKLTVPKVLAYPNPWEQFVDVFSRTKRTLGTLFAPVLRRPSLVKARHMSGPIGILQMIFYKVLVDGYRGGLSFIILVSFSLAFFNLLPLPVLDGGHIV
ncbi:MAG: hypothetical protein HN849_02905, partial [Victivallales bacterium]|nr:hypothetical protein [Victivallales bacterium]